jgi:type I restriction enzyme M protein
MKFNRLWGHLDAAEYKHLVLGLILLKYIYDAFNELYEKLAEDEYPDPEARRRRLIQSREYILPPPGCTLVTFPE